MKKKHKADYIDNEQELEVLSKYYPVDRQSKLVTVTFHADNVEELLEHPSAPGFRPLFKNDFFENCQELIAKFPAPYRINAEIVLEDWEGHTPHELTQSFRDSLSIMQKTGQVKGRRALFMSALFVIAGFLILALMACGQEMGWFGEGFSAALWEEVVDIAGWVFLWEAVTVAFLETSEQSISDPRIRKRIAFLTFRNTDETLLLRVSDEQLFQIADWTFLMKRIVRDCLLISSCGFVLLGINVLIYIPQIENLATGGVAVFACVIIFVLSALQIAAGVGGFYRFWGRRNGFTTFSKVYAFCSLAIIAILVTNSMDSFSSIMSIVISFCCQLLFIFSLFVDGRIASRYAKQAQQD